MYLTWSAMTNEPGKMLFTPPNHRNLPVVNSTLFSCITDRKCNPSLLGIIGLNTTVPVDPGHVVQWWDAQGIVGLILFLMCVLYSR